jgi:hypothetical protein
MMEQPMIVWTFELRFYIFFGNLLVLTRRLLVPKTTSDTAFLQGKLASGAVASINFRHAFGDAVDNVRLRWLITGTEGEIEVTDPTPSKRSFHVSEIKSTIL